MAEQEHAERKEQIIPDFYDQETQLFEEFNEPAPALPWWRQRRWQILLILILLFLLIGGSALTVVALRKGRVTYQYQRVTRGTFTQVVNATGTLQGSVYNVNAPTSGKITALYVSVGQQVRSGQVLAKLDSTSLQDAVNQAQAQVNAAQTALTDAQNNLSKVQAQVNASLATAYDQEQNALYNCDHPALNQSVPPNCKQLAEDQYAQAQSQAEAQLASAQAQVDNAQSQLKTAQAQLATAQHNLNLTTITAPHAGVVATINGSVGSYPGGPIGGTTSGLSGTSQSSSSSAGTTGAVSSPATTAFIQLVDLSSLQITANVNEADIGAVNTGQQVHFTVSAYGNRQFSGTIRAISPLGQSVSNVVTYPVTINVDLGSARGAHLLPGMTANLTITTLQHEDVLLVPTDAINFARNAATLSERNGSPVIDPAQVKTALAQAHQLLQDLHNLPPGEQPTPGYVLERSGERWVVKPVVLGLTDGNTYEVLAGLELGESIVTGAQGGPFTALTQAGS
ncbi:efflux RND transporter periplasmic adaptor subunit [Thermogemmatispora sp.]|uniref:efflux RND transporter periplasmic adaptor subunit n=2 Tax=Thermogemmatispora sp. TaxID=1968838 RepID=UPI002ACBED3E|nr:efflux RND transporter periplasmic adaptor subunit [Thermogemmatispora sp.]